MQIFAHIQRVSFTLLAVAIFILAPTVSAMTPPSCCLEGGMMNDPALQQTQNHSVDSHCDEMNTKEMGSEEAHNVCKSGCTGSCCSIYLSIGITFSEPETFSETFASSLVRPENVNSHSTGTRFPTPPPKHHLSV
ncbi:MAG: hypothetical protein AB3N28_14355 [Kordiimonas sp.]